MVRRLRRVLVLVMLLLWLLLRWGLRWGWVEVLRWSSLLILLVGVERVLVISMLLLLRSKD